jgi:CheY-like chemotaxis protein
MRRSLSESKPGDNDPVAGITRPLVLFADDDAVGRAIARRVLDSMGLGVIVAADGQAALALAREYKPELLITDAFMPKLDGRELARTIKEERPATKVIVISGVYKDPRYKHEALKDFKVDDYLTKPVDPASLLRAVQKLLN